MSVRWYSVAVVLILIGLQIPGLGQNPPSQNPNEESGATRAAPAGAVSAIIGTDTRSEEESNDQLPQIPSMLGGRGNSLAFLSEMEHSNYIRGGVNVGAAYDDNAMLAPRGQVGNTTYSVFPNISLNESTPRMRWSLGYGGGLTVNQRLSSRNQGSHNLGFDSEFRLSPHVNLRAAEDFFLSSGMFGANAMTGEQPGLGGTNGTLITPLATVRSSQTVVETNYRFALKDAIGASGSFYDLHYSNVSSGTLANTRTAGGSAFWLHQLFRDDWGGVSYRFQRLTYGPVGETRVQSLAFIDTFGIAREFTLSVYIGPEYSVNHGIAATGTDAGQITSFSQWSTTGGVEVGWQKNRTSLTAGYSKQVSNGAGLVGAVRLQSIHAGLRRELRPGWAAAVTATYGNNQSLTLVSTTAVPSIKATSVGASLERDIGKNFGLQLAYFHDLQNQSGSGTGSQNFDANRNRFSATLSYQWARPLGR
jgi:hypothetical protein